MNTMQVAIGLISSTLIMGYLAVSSFISPELVLSVITK